MTEGTEHELGRLTAHVEALCESFREHNERNQQWQNSFDAKLFGPDGMFARHSARIRALERWRDGLAAVIAALGVAAAWVSSWWVGQR